METLVPATLRQKPALELFSMRKRVAGELETLADNAQGRNYTTDETQGSGVLVVARCCLDGWLVAVSRSRPVRRVWVRPGSRAGWSRPG